MLERYLVEFVTKCWVRSFSLRGGDNINCDHQAQTSDSAQFAVFPLNVLQTLFQLNASGRGVGDVFTLQQVKGGQRGDATDRIAPESAGMTATRPIHHLIASDDRP